MAKKKKSKREQTNHTVTEVKPSERVPYKTVATFSNDAANLVDPVSRETNQNEVRRQKNNRTRDSRTNLGRGKPSQVVTAGE